MEVTSQLGPEYSTDPCNRTYCKFPCFMDRGTDVSPQLECIHQCSFGMQLPGFSIHSRSARRVTRFISHFLRTTTVRTFAPTGKLPAPTVLVSDCPSPGPWIRDDLIPWDDASNSIPKHGPTRPTHPGFFFGKPKLERAPMDTRAESR